MSDNKFFKVEITAEERQNDKGKWLAFTAYDKNGKKMRAMFTSAVTTKPTKSGDYIVKVPVGEMNVSTARRYPVLWINAVEECVPASVDRKAKATERLMTQFFTD